DVMMVGWGGRDDELVGTNVMTRESFFLQMPRDHQLGRDARMIHSRQPKRAPAQHPLVARQHVHHCVLQSVAHVQGTSNVRWRDYDRIDRRGCVFVYFRSEITALFPERVMRTLGFFGIIGFGNINHAVKIHFMLEAGYGPPDLKTSLKLDCKSWAAAFHLRKGGVSF